MSENQATIDYPPYITAYGLIPNLFDAIKKAAVPNKFTQDFLSTVLGLKSSSYRASIPLLKKLEFIDQSSVPTQNYKDFRDESISKVVMARSIKKAYENLYRAHEYAHKLTKPELISKLKTLTGASSDDGVLKTVVGTFSELCKLADFEGQEHRTSTPIEIQDSRQQEPSSHQFLQIHTPQAQIAQVQMPHKLGLSYTINLNLPATTDIEVFHAIFKSLKEHILNE